MSINADGRDMKLDSICLLTHGWCHLIQVRCMFGIVSRLYFKSNDIVQSQREEARRMDCLDCRYYMLLCHVGPRSFVSVSAKVLLYIYDARGIGSNCVSIAHTFLENMG